MAKPNPFVQAWKYFMSWFGAKVDEKADPKIQIQQAIQEAQSQHAAADPPGRARSSATSASWR